MTKKTDILIGCLFLLTIVLATFGAISVETKRVKKECTTMFASATTPHDSLLVVVNTPECRTFVDKENTDKGPFEEKIK